MEVIIKSISDTAPIWDHFLLKDMVITIKYTDITNHTGEDILFRAGGQYRWELNDRIVVIELMVRSVFRYNGINYPLLKILQRFNVVRENNRATSIEPDRWQKLSPDQATGLAKGVPNLHPLLRFSAGIVTVAIEFVDITRLFNDIHGATPWFMALELLRGTQRTIRVLASLRGHPFIWYVVIPDSSAAKQNLQPNLLYFPADYGGISYPSNSLEGITSPNHNTSVGNIQCGGETLFSFLTNPLSDADYDTKLEKYLVLSASFKRRSGRNPPPLHHFREVLSYDPSAGTLVPRYWDIPFGFEQALFEKQQILLVPQINGADGGIAVKAGLKDLVQSALLLIYTHGNTLNNDSVAVSNPILICYSQSGGNLFTACNRNLDQIKAIVCFEPQYMNEYLSKEDRSLSLGKDVIPLLLKQGGKVAVIGRHKSGWESKYLPSKTSQSDLIILPDDAHYFILEYPQAAKPYDPSASPVLARRYSRLLKNTKDPVINEMLTRETGVIDYESAAQEAKVEEVIARYRKAGFSDEKVIKTVFTADYNIDASGGYFTHNFIVSSGQELAADGKSVLSFFRHALNLIS